MPRYRVTRWSKSRRQAADDEPKPLATKEVDAPNAGQACDLLGWKLGECSIQLLAGPLQHWKEAKGRVRKAYQRTPTKALLIWRDMPFLGHAHNMDDLQLLEALAQQIESMAEILQPDDSAPDVSEYLSDTYLLVTFAMWRVFSKRSEYIQSHCRYCDTPGELVKWETPVPRAIEEDKPMHVYVCLANTSCWKHAFNEGYNAISDNRRRMVEILVKGGTTQSQIREILRVSRSTVGKDIRILKSLGRI